MKKQVHYFGGFILAAILIAIGYALITQPRVDSTGKTHTELYEEAQAVWDAQTRVGLFREQEVDGETIGSSTALSVEWDAPATDFNHYVLSISTPDGFLRSEASEKERARLDLTGLKANTTYTLALQACLDRACEDWIISKDETTATTPEEVWTAVDTISTDGENLSMDGPLLLNP